MRRLEADHALPPETLAEIAAVLAAGGLIIVPTETVYGVAAAVSSAAGAARLYEAKARPEGKPLQILATVAAARELAADWPAAAERLAAAWWPGPLTLVVPAADSVPTHLQAADQTVGLRCPDHPLLTHLLATVGPLAASSANRSGEPPAVTCSEAIAALGELVELALDAGPAGYGQPSTVVRVTVAVVTVLRVGAVPAEAILAVAKG